MLDLLVMFGSEELINESSRTALLSLFSFLVAMLLTPIYTHFAFKYKIWRRPRQNSVTGEALKIIKKYRIKRTVPVMAGLILVAAVTITTVIFNLDRQQTWLPLAALLAGGFVGLVDDILNVRGKDGLRAPLKLGLLTLVASVGAWWFYSKLGFDSIQIPFAGDLTLGWFLIPLFVLVVVSTGNAVNISDGLDGLAGGLSLNAFSAYGVIALLQGQFGIAAFCFTVAGALLSYIWFNIPPARFFMGDVGSFSLGTSLGVVAMLTDTIFLLPIIGFVFLAEAGSSLLQIFSKKVFHRRIFIAAPIHHHFEGLEWPKTKVTMRFWVISQVCAAAGVVLAIVGGYVK